MFWALLSGIGACCDAAYYIVNKKFLQKQVTPDLLAAAGFLVASLLLLAIAFFRGIPQLGPDFLPAVVSTCAINVLGTTLAFRALKSTDLSLAVPMLSFTPLFLLVTAALMLGEIPSVIGITGILVIVTGSYILNTAAEHTSLFDPFRAMITHPGILNMLFVSFLYAIAIGFDKMVVLNSDIVFGSGIVFFILGTAFLIIFVITWAIVSRRNPVSPGPEPVPPRVSPFLHARDLLGAGIAIGTLLTIEAIVINTAYLGQIVPYVSAIKRMSILFTVVYGTLVFREQEVLRRITGASLMVLGVVLILLFP
jgi:drug/metabolite transporter (DMT)-like permease